MRSSAGLAALVVVTALLGAPPALARTERDFGYGFQQIWPVLVRFLRVDEKLKVTEKDPDAGYVLFELVDGKRTFAGAAELLHAADGVTRVVIRINDRPSYMESGMLDRLQDKLHEELGEPPPAPEPPPARTPPPASAPITRPRG